MKQRRFHILICVVLTALSSVAFPCSMFKVNVNGKTLVGNNEDYWSPETWLWVVNSTRDKLGVVFFGFDNFFPQGGINERGLVFDGFATPAKGNLPAPVGTQNIDAKQFIMEVMTTCSTIREVKALVDKYNIDEMSSAQLMFVDKSGASMIVEGGNIIIESGKPYQVATNFYQSEIKQSTSITCWRYLAAQQMLESESRPGVEYCREILERVHQEGDWGGTQYSNIYDLGEGKIHLYLFHNFDEAVTLTVKDLLAKKDYRARIGSLFSDTKEYDNYRKNYLDAQSITAKAGGVDDQTKLKGFLDRLRANPQTALWIDQLITSSDEQLSRSNNKNCLLILELARQVAPRNLKASYALAKAYFVDKNNDEALREIDRGLAQWPGDASLTALKKQILDDTH